MTASITPDELVVAGGHWTTRSPAVIRWDRGRLTVDQFRAEGPPGTITASAVMEAGGSDARIAIGLEQARLPPPFDRATPGEARGGGAAHQDRAGGRCRSAAAGRWERCPWTAACRSKGRSRSAAGSSPTAAELARALGRDRVAGQAIVSADLSGSWQEPVAIGRLEATALTSAAATLTGVTVPFRLTPSTIRIADARAVLGKDPLALEGEASRGTEGWRGRGTLTAPVLTVGGWPIEALHAAFRVDAERLEATAVSTRIHGVAVRGTGSWQWSGGGRLEARLGPAELAELRGAPPALDLGGSASGRLEAVFRSLDDVTASLALRFDGVRAAGEALGAGTLAAELRGRAVRADLGFPERRLSAVAEGRAEAGATMRVRAAVDDLPLGELGRRLGLGERATVDGSVSVRLLAEVPLDHPESAARDAPSGPAPTRGRGRDAHEPGADRRELRRGRAACRAPAPRGPGGDDPGPRDAPRGRRPRCRAPRSDPAGRARGAPARGGSGQRDPGRDGDRARHERRRRRSAAPQPSTARASRSAATRSPYARSTRGSPRLPPACVWSRPGAFSAAGP